MLKPKSQELILKEQTGQSTTENAYHQSQQTANLEQILAEAKNNFANNTKELQNTKPKKITQQHAPRSEERMR